jgi:hypothetical protein
MELAVIVPTKKVVISLVLGRPESFFQQLWMEVNGASSDSTKPKGGYSFGAWLSWIFLQQLWMEVNVASSDSANQKGVYSIGAWLSWIFLSAAMNGS